MAQMNVAELATLALGGMKQADFLEKVFDPSEFFGTGLSYEAPQLRERVSLPGACDARLIASILAVIPEKAN